jgi:hypothetical protein
MMIQLYCEIISVNLYLLHDIEVKKSALRNQRSSYISMAHDLC